MAQSVARDLLLLAAIAFKRKEFDKSGSLFAASLSSDDADELLKELEGGEHSFADEKTSNIWGDEDESDAPRADEIDTTTDADAKSISASMAAAANSFEEVEEELNDGSDSHVSVNDIVEEEDTEEEASGDLNVIPSSLSSSNAGGVGTDRIRLVMTGNGPVGVRK